MTYIVHKRLKARCIHGNVNLPYGTELESNGNLILHDGNPLCFVSSQVAKEHLARNDDGHGLERGSITHSIAFAGDKLNKQQKEFIKQHTQWMRKDSDFLFNDAFFSADINDLRKLKNELEELRNV